MMLELVLFKFIIRLDIIIIFIEGGKARQN